VLLSRNDRHTLVFWVDRVHRPLRERCYVSQQVLIVAYVLLIVDERQIKTVKDLKLLQEF